MLQCNVCKKIVKILKCYNQDSDSKFKKYVCENCYSQYSKKEFLGIKYANPTITINETWKKKEVDKNE